MTATASTEWPSVTITPEARKLIDTFFSLTESKAEDSGNRLAQEVFSPKGRFVTPHGTYTGPDEIGQSRKHAWDALDFRRHDIFKVYASDLQGKDIMMLGRLIATKKDGSSSETNLVARVILETVDGQLRFALYQAQAWGVK